MTLPNVSTTVQDGSLGISPGTARVQSVSFGISEKGSVGTVYSFSDPTSCYNTLGEGPLTEAVCLKIALAGGTHYAVPLTPLFDGAASSAVTKVGTGEGLMTVLFAPKQTITVYCSTAGTLGTAEFQFKLGTGSYSAPVVSAAGWATAYQVPGTLTRLVFTAGDGFDLTDTWTISTVGVITQTVNAGAATGTIGSQNSQPLDDYEVKALISKAGAAGTGEFRFSLDGGNYTTDGLSVDGNSNAATGSYSASIPIPSGLKYALPNTGIYLTFNNNSGTFHLNDLHSFNTVTTGFNTSAVTTGYTTFLANTSATYDLGHVVGVATSAANAATLASTVDSAHTTAATTNKRWFHTIVECPSSTGGGTLILSGGAAIHDTADTDSVVTTAFVSSSHKRAGFGVGDVKLISVISGRQYRRNVAWIATAWKCALKRSQNASEVAAGALPYVVALFRDEATASTSLDTARAITARTFVGKSGYFIARGQTLADTTSDFSRQANRMVIDKATALAYASAVNFIEAPVNVNANGTITEADALRIEKTIRKAIDDVMLSGGDLSGETTVTVSRSQNVLSTSTIPINIRVLPKGYSTFVENTIGFVNPSIAAAA